MISIIKKAYNPIKINKQINKQIYNTLKVPLLKYCYGRDSFIDESICECTSICNMTYNTHKKNDKKNKKITYHTHQTCSLTQEYRNINDCLCINNCSADKNELMLYDDKYA